MARILDRSFRYTPAVETDVTRLFKRVDPQWNIPPGKRRRRNAAATRKARREGGTLIKLY